MNRCLVAGAIIVTVVLVCFTALRGRHCIETRTGATASEARGVTDELCAPGGDPAPDTAQGSPSRTNLQS